MNQLGKRLYRGERDAFVELYDLYGDKLFRYVVSRLKSPDDAPDVVQEVFVRMVKSHRKLAKAEHMGAYLFTIARNEVFRWLRSKNKTTTSRNLSGDGLDGIEDVSEPLSRVDSKDWINTVLQFLEPVDQEIVQLKALSELTFAEIAQVLKLQPSNVATRYRRSLIKLEAKCKKFQLKNKGNPT